MAAGTDLSRSISEGSQEFHDCPCTPCTQDDKHVAAVKFCIECQEHLCDSCLKQHNRFAATITHSLLDKGSNPVATLQALIQNLPTEKCDQHQGLVELFCKDHDEVCCRACVVPDHSSCKGMLYIPNAAQGMKHDPEVKDVKEQMQAVLVDLHQIRKAREEDCHRIEKEKNRSMTMIKDFRKKMDKTLDKLEKQTTDQVQHRHTIFENKIKEDIKLVDNMIMFLQTKIKLLEGNCGNNETQLFINVKKGKKFIKDRKKLSKNAENAIGREIIQIHIKNEIEKILEDNETLGYLYHKEVNVKVKTDTSGCYVVGSCQLEDGTTLISDSGNNKLKRLDKSYGVKDYIDLPGEPYGICCTGPQEVAVTIQDQKKIQFLSVSGQMTPTKSFSVGVKCQGVAYSNSELFVSCEGGRHEGQGHMRVYDKEGQLLRTFQNDPTGQQIFNWPHHIAVSLDGSHIYTADWRKGIITLDRQGQVISTPRLQQHPHSVGIYVDNKDQLVVCGMCHDNVMQLKPDGSNRRVLLKKSDGIEDPTSVCCDQKNQKLLITMQFSDIVKVYDLA